VLFHFHFVSKVSNFLFSIEKKKFIFLSVSMGKKSLNFQRLPKLQKYSQNLSLDFFGRLPLIKRCFLLGFFLAIFQKNEHSLVATEQMINIRSALAVAVAFWGWERNVIKLRIIVL